MLTFNFPESTRIASMQTLTGRVWPCAHNWFVVWGRVWALSLTLKKKGIIDNLMRLCIYGFSVYTTAILIQVSYGPNLVLYIYNIISTKQTSFKYSRPLEASKYSIFWINLSNMIYTLRYMKIFVFVSIAAVIQKKTHAERIIQLIMDECSFINIEVPHPLNKLSSFGFGRRVNFC